MIPELFDVLDRVEETQDTFTLTLRHGGAESEARRFYDALRPGQFNMVYVPGSGEVPISISAIPDSLDRVVHTIRSVGTVTEKLKRIGPGGRVGIRGPFGTAWPVDRASGKNVIVVAGGIGLAPLRPVIHELIANRSRYKQVMILYGARTPGELLFRNEIDDWTKRSDLSVTLTVDRADSQWNGHVGVVPRFIALFDFDPSESIALVCGPEIMMQFTVRALESKGMTDESIYVSMERNMKCGIRLCGHCQYGPHFICENGPVFAFSEIQNYFGIKEL